MLVIIVTVCSAQFSPYEPAVHQRVLQNSDVTWLCVTSLALKTLDLHFVCNVVVGGGGDTSKFHVLLYALTSRFNGSWMVPYRQLDVASVQLDVVSGYKIPGKTFHEDRNAHEVVRTSLFSSYTLLHLRVCIFHLSSFTYIRKSAPAMSLPFSLILTPYCLVV